MVENPHKNYTIIIEGNQSIYNGKDIWYMIKVDSKAVFGAFSNEDFRKFRRDNEKLSKLMHEIDEEITNARTPKFISRFDDCGNVGKIDVINNKKMRFSANRCGNPFCAVCGRVKQQKEYERILYAMNDYIFHNPANYNIHFVTVSFKNIPVEEYTDTVISTRKALRALYNAAGVYTRKGIVGHSLSGQIGNKTVGSYWRFESTYNYKTNEMHPHYHAIVVMKEGQTILPEVWREGLMKQFDLNYEPQIYIEPVHFEEEDDIIENVARICRYMNKGQDFEWDRIPHEKAISLVRQMVVDLKKVQYYVAAGFFVDSKYTKTRMSKCKSEPILDEIGERTEGMTDEEIDNVTIVNPETKIVYTHEEKKVAQMALWNMSNTALACMTSEEGLKGALSSAILRIKKKCAMFYEQKQNEFSNISITTLATILNRERDRRERRLFKERLKEEQAKETYKVVYNRVLGHYMVTSHTYMDSFGNRVCVGYQSYCAYDEFEDKLNSEEIIPIAENVYVFRGGGD